MVGLTDDSLLIECVGCGVPDMIPGVSGPSYKTGGEYDLCGPCNACGHRLSRVTGTADYIEFVRRDLGW